MSIDIPHIDPDADTLTAALAYAAAGLYVGPVRRGTKHPGSVLGGGWQALTSTDPKVISSWFAGTDCGIFIHAGRSGLIVADVDTPANLHPLLRRAVDELAPPFQTTRVGEAERGHYLFQQPEGRMLGNSLGGLASGWGELRGHNGVIVVAPSEHTDPDGLYQWQRVGAVPVFPDYCAEQIGDAMPSEAAASDAQVDAFLDAHEDEQRPELVGIHVRGFEKQVEAGESRHQSMTGHLAGAMREAAAGLVDARTAADTLEGAFLGAVTQASAGPKQGAARSGAAARTEWRGLLSWAIAQATGADPEQTRARVAEKVPDAEAQVRGLVATQRETAETLGVGQATVSRHDDYEGERGRPRNIQTDNPTPEPDDVIDAEVPEPLDVITASAVTLRRVRYLWQQRIPLGAASLMPGEEGIGKTTVGIRIMADLTRGLLPGEFYGTPRDVIVMATEDGIEDVFVPRLQEAGADLARVHIIRARVGLEGDQHSVIVPRDLSVIGDLVREHDAALVWIDSLVTTLPDELKSISYKDTAKVLRRLGEWASTEAVAVVAPWHLNKASGSDTAVRIMDSRAFRTAIRSMLLVVADPDAPEGTTRGIVALDKANAGSLDVPGLRYELRSSAYEVEELDEQTGEVRTIAASCGVADWIGEVDGDGRQLARDALAPKIEKQGGPRQWLREYLEGEGEAARSEVMAAAADEGFSVDAMKRAARALSIHSREESGQEDGRPYRRAVWSLPSRGESGSQSVHSHPTAPTAPTGEGSTAPTTSSGPGMAQSVQWGRSGVSGEPAPTEDQPAPTGNHDLTCAYQGCTDPPRPGKQMCARHFTYEPSRKDNQ